MMYVSGETAEPPVETTSIIEDIVRQQVIELVRLPLHPLSSPLNTNPHSCETAPNSLRVAVLNPSASTISSSKSAMTKQKSHVCAHSSRGKTCERT